MTVNGGISWRVTISLILSLLDRHIDGWVDELTDEDTELNDTSGSRDAIVTRPGQCNDYANTFDDAEHEPYFLFNFLEPTIRRLKRHEEPELEKTSNNHKAAVSYFLWLEGCVDATGRIKDSNQVDGCRYEDEIKPVDLPDVVC